jgi:hypothetical protein
MEQSIGCDAHKKFSVFVAVNERGYAWPQFGYCFLGKGERNTIRKH